jgi:prepilin-type N-terminal cleavage/methylation domain-containing protein
MAGSDRRNAFTLVELLVVITILALLVGMVFPAMQSMVERNRRRECGGRMGDLAKAVALYEQRNGGFPSLVERIAASARNPKGNKVTWAVQLLGDLDAPLYDTWKMEPPQSDAEAQRSQAMHVSRVSVFTCASDATAGSDQPLSFVANAGSIADARVPRPNHANGVFFHRLTPHAVQRRRLMMSDLLEGDGVDFTLLLSENLQALHWGDKRQSSGERPQPYDADGTSATETQQFTGFVFDGYGINQGDGRSAFNELPSATSPQWARPSSNHPGGVNVVYASGKQVFMEQDVDVNVYRRLVVSNGKRSDLPDDAPYRMGPVPPEKVPGAN